MILANKISINSLMMSNFVHFSTWTRFNCFFS